MAGISESSYGGTLPPQMMQQAELLSFLARSGVIDDRALWTYLLAGQPEQQQQRPAEPVQYKGQQYGPGSANPDQAPGAAHHVPDWWRWFIGGSQGAQ